MNLSKIIYNWCFCIKKNRLISHKKSVRATRSV